ncbi:hypothetical protein EG68_12395 [Paragonimus skrjabini miyazakii]|uniref:Protein-S-isoprenylcysteine O-methyltransferase n=1 Tax=Paragonimus skrjabini miyazakii TaxID=59628 RepID=A0A8S9YK04_9TREM|nr:hypothetical protein EG68_12395 [Paragonimus skrjabini miyazakii]
MATTSSNSLLFIVFKQSSDAIISLIGFLAIVKSLCIVVLCTFLFSSLYVALFVIFLTYLHDAGFRQCDILQNSCRALGLGTVCAVGLTFVLASQYLDIPKMLWPFGLYLIFLSFFHWSEFYFTAVYNPTCCSIDIYMITHSPEYVFAAAASVVEYLFRMFLFPSWCCIPSLVHIIGLFMCVGGEMLRKMAIITAASNFNHYIELTKRPNHTLVTHGIYSWFRHPAYVGWFYWALGTQLLLGNPLCFVAYALAAHKFFRDRIEYEERQLIYFFPQDYCEYQRKVGVGIPFIQGYKPLTAEHLS